MLELSPKDSPTREGGALAKAIRNLRIVWRLVRDGRVPLRTKLVPLVMLVYVVLPADLLPDYILGVGQVDDVAVVLAACRLFLSLCPKEVVREHQLGLGDAAGEPGETEDEEADSSSG